MDQYTIQMNKKAWLDKCHPKKMLIAKRVTSFFTLRPDIRFRVPRDILARERALGIIQSAMEATGYMPSGIFRRVLTELTDKYI